MTFKIGDKVRWSSQAAGIVRTKEGEVIEVVPAYARPQKRTAAQGLGHARNHESYMVKAKAVGTLTERTKLYWPIVKLLEPMAIHESLGDIRSHIGAEEIARIEDAKLMDELSAATAAPVEHVDGIEPEPEEEEAPPVPAKSVAKQIADKIISVLNDPIERLLPMELIPPPKHNLVEQSDGTVVEMSLEAETES